MRGSFFEVRFAAQDGRMRGKREQHNEASLGSYDPTGQPRGG